MPLPGHTPGHTGYLVASDGESLLISGDFIHVPEVPVARPEVTIQFDMDPAQAAAARRRMPDMAASEQVHVAGMHLHVPGTAHIAREGHGDRLYPDAWENTTDGGARDRTPARGAACRRDISRYLRP